MNIETANRLQNLRKQSGFSQEELAAKLGISRQAVSKWERAEASPDTDNLIALAKLYGVTLDDLLRTETKTSVSSGISLHKEDYTSTSSAMEDDGEIYPGRRFNSEKAASYTEDAVPQGAPGVCDSSSAADDKPHSDIGGASGSCDAHDNSAESNTYTDFAKNVSDFAATVTKEALTAASKGLAEANKRMNEQKKNGTSSEQQTSEDFKESFEKNFEEFGKNIEKTFNGTAAEFKEKAPAPNIKFETVGENYPSPVEAKGVFAEEGRKRERHHRDKDEPEATLFQKLFAVIVTCAFLFVGGSGMIPWKYAWLLFFLIPIYYIGVKPRREFREKKRGFFSAIFSYLDGALPILIAAFYIMVSLFFGVWHPLWMIFFLIPLYYTTKEAILKRNLMLFCFPVAVAWLYLIIGFLGNWVIGLPLFAAIPFYYIIVDHFRRKNGKK